MPSPGAWRFIRPRALSEDRPTSTSDLLLTSTAIDTLSTSPTSTKASKPPRIKVSSACLSCKHKKCRCDGRQPCFACVTRQVDCAYDETSDMRRNRVSRNVTQSLSNQVDGLTSENGALADRVKLLTAQVQALTTQIGAVSERSSHYQQLLEALSTVSSGQAIGLLARLRGYLEAGGPDNPDPLLKATRLTIPDDDSFTNLLETDEDLSALSDGGSWHGENFSTDRPAYSHRRDSSNGTGYNVFGHDLGIT